MASSSCAGAFLRTPNQFQGRADTRLRQLSALRKRNQRELSNQIKLCLDDS